MRLRMFIVSFCVLLIQVHIPIAALASEDSYVSDESIVALSVLAAADAATSVINLAHENGSRTAAILGGASGVATLLATASVADDAGNDAALIALGALGVVSSISALIGHHRMREARGSRIEPVISYYDRGRARLGLAVRGSF